MSKTRPIVPVNFDNDEELFSYVNSKVNRAEFIRYCIRKEMMEEKKNLGSERDLEERIERILMRCLENYQPVLKSNAVKEENEEVEISLEEAAVFFEFDED